MTARTTEEAAAEVLAELDRAGWCQKPFVPVPAVITGDIIEPACANLALRNVLIRENLLDGGWRGTPYQSLIDRLSALVEQEGWAHVPQWNDDPRTTEEDVRLMIKKAGHDD